MDQFEDAGSVLKGKSAGRPRKSNEKANAVMEAFSNRTLRSELGEHHLIKHSKKSLFMISFTNN